MGLHQLGDDLVLALQLVAQRRDSPQVRLLRCPALTLESRCTVLEEELLPSVKDRWRKLVLITDVGDRHVIDQMAPQDGDLLSRGVTFARLSHRRNSSRVFYYSGVAFLHFKLKQDKGTGRSPRDSRRRATSFPAWGRRCS